MDPHPTPFPGKHRRPGGLVNKGKSENMGSKEPNIVPARYRKNRVFGTIRSTNITVEKPTQKPPPLKTYKPLKPLATSVKPTIRDGTWKKSDSNKTPDNVTKDSKRVGIKKPSAVSFQEPLSSEKISRKSISSDDGPCTPISMINRPVVSGTPYLSAQNCSKCRLDRLESASYWITQIKLAESVGKHFVSAAFFRLALECRAEPSRRLRTELKSYVERHLSASSIWPDVCQLYGLLDDKSEVGACDLNDVFPSVDDENSTPNMQSGMICEDHKGCACLDCDTTDIPSLVMPEEETLENPDARPLELKESFLNEAYVDVANDEGVADLECNTTDIPSSVVMPEEETLENPVAVCPELEESLGNEAYVDVANDGGVIYLECDTTDIPSFVMPEEETLENPDAGSLEMKVSFDKEAFSESENNGCVEDRTEFIPNASDGSPLKEKPCDVVPVSSSDVIKPLEDNASGRKLSSGKASLGPDHNCCSSSASSPKKHRPGDFMGKAEGRLSKPRAKSKSLCGDLVTGRGRVGARKSNNNEIKNKGKADSNRRILPIR